MIQTTRGIVLHITNFSETSVIAGIYTRAWGIQSYLIKGARKKNSKTAMSLLQPLSIVEFTAHHKENRDLQFLSELNVAAPLIEIPNQISKSSIAFFVSEILYKSIREQEPNTQLFDFIQNHILFLDAMNESCKQFHLYFLLQLTKQLGFFPAGIYDEQNIVFDLREGVFQNNYPPYGEFTTDRISELISLFSSATVSTHHLIATSSTERKELLEMLILYFNLHVLQGAKINSHKVLMEVL